VVRRLLLALVAAGLIVAGHALNGHFDLKVYYGATRAWLHGADLYGFVEHGRDRDYGFTYPPFGALVMAPIAVLPWPVAAVVFDALSVAATVVVLRLVAAPRQRDALVLAGLLVLAFAFDPWRTTYNYGQINLILLALVTVDLLLLVDRRRSAGALIGVAAAVKLVPLIFIGYLLLTRRFRAAATAAGTFGLATLLMVAVAPGASRTFWTSAIWQGDRIGDPAFVSNQSLYGLISRYDGSPIAWAGLVLLVLGGWAWAVLRRRDPGFGLALTGVVAGLVSPITWVHHRVWLIPALALLARRRWPAALAAAVAYAVLCSRVVWHVSRLADAYLLVAAGLLVVLLVCGPRDSGRPAAPAHG
jgi:alpha-1,2-mannosyltransferase